MLAWRGALFVSLLVVVVGRKRDPAKLDRLNYQAGDTVLTSVIKCFHLVIPPYHSLFAVQNDELLQVGYATAKMNTVGFAPVKRYNIPYNLVGAKGFVVSPRSRSVFVLKRYEITRITISPIGEAGVKLARRLVNNQDKLPYHLLRCNCRHYCDYLTYGTTFGSYRNIGYLPISAVCPLHDTITKDTDTTAPDFVLRDKNKKAYILE